MATVPTQEDIMKQLRKENKKDIKNSDYFKNGGKLHNAESSFFSPDFIASSYHDKYKTIPRNQAGAVSCSVLRAIASKAWIINICINHICKKAKPFFKQSTDKNIRGFIVYKNNSAKDKYNSNDKEAKAITNFILKTGSYTDTERDSFVKFGTRLVRDLLTLDQIATEIQYNKKNEPVAFFAVDSATIEKVLHDDTTKDESEEDKDVKYIQVVNGIVTAAYKSDEMLFDYENPRTDIYHSQYGFSYVEQAVDLITTVINAFMYNAGNFTENKLPKGMLLINGDASQDVVDEMTDYIAEILSGSPLNQWRIPVIPSGSKDATIEWKQLNGNNREMEFQGFMDYLTSAVVAMFGCSMDELGLQSQKSQNLFESSGNAKIQASKSLVLGDVLSFFEDYINKIVEKINPEYKFEFVGYEKDDPSTIADLDEKECRTWKSVNEKRIEKGLKPINLEKIKNGADIPMNVQLVQLLQSQMAQGGMGDGGMDMGDNGGGDDESWQDYSDIQTGDENFENPEENEPDNTEPTDGIEKSLSFINKNKATKKLFVI